MHVGGLKCVVINLVVIPVINTLTAVCA